MKLHVGGMARALSQHHTSPVSMKILPVEGVQCKMVNLPAESDLVRMKTNTVHWSIHLKHSLALKIA